MKTLYELWLENGRSSKNLYVRSHTNKIKKFKVRMLNTQKELAVLTNRGTGLKYFTTYHNMFSINNRRWEKV